MHRKRTANRTIVTALILILLTLFNVLLSAASFDADRIAAGSFIVIDFETGMELYSQNADRLRGPASMTKMMSVYLVYEAIENGQIGYDTIVPISSGVAELSRNPAETNIPLAMSDKYTVSELLDAVVVVSAAGAIRALAELIAGSRAGFVEMMNNKADQWGIDATFRSVSGGSGGSDGTNMTARAMAVITRNTILRFPEVLEKTALPSIDVAGQIWPSTNTLLGVYDGIDGFKTGTSSSTGANFAGTAQRGDIRIITVVMGSTPGRRFTDTSALMDYGFSTMEEYRHGFDKAAPTHLPVIVNDNEFQVGAYNLRGSDYFDISDIAYMLRNTPAQFGIDFDYADDMILLTDSDTNFAAHELSNVGEDRSWAVPTSAIIRLNNNELSVYGYEIQERHFFSFSDISDALGFYIDTDYDNDAISILFVADDTADNGDDYMFDPPIDEVVVITPIPAQQDEVSVDSIVLPVPHYETSYIRFSEVTVFLTVIMGYVAIKKRNR